MADLRSSAPVALTFMFILAGGIGVGAQTGDFPLGTYQADPFTITLEQGGTFRVVHSSGAGVTGTYKVSGDKIEFTDQEGDLVCQGSTGKYTWKADHDSLIFSIVDDVCDGRAEALTSKPLVRKKGE